MRMNKMLQKSFDPVHVRLTTKSRKNSHNKSLQKKMKAKKPKNIATPQSVAGTQPQPDVVSESKVVPSNMKSDTKKNNKTKANLKQENPGMIYLFFSFKSTFNNQFIKTIN